MPEQSETLVLDPATMAKALTRLGLATGTGRTWYPGDDQSPNYRPQVRFLEWYGRNLDGVETLGGLKAEASDSADVLNKFLIENGFPGMFRQLSPGGVGAAAILDMLVRWAIDALKTNLTTYDPTNGYQAKHYGAFELRKIPGSFEVFDVPGHKERLVKLNTKEGAAVWLIMADRPQHGLDLVELAVNALITRVAADTEYVSSVIVPNLEIDTKADLSWMLGVNAGDHRIDQAFQIFKLRMNEEGARVKVATGFATMRGGPRVAQPLRFDRPFAGWFTQPGSEIPMAAFYAGTDSWKTSNEGLEDL